MSVGYLWAAYLVVGLGLALYLVALRRQRASLDREQTGSSRGEESPDHQAV